MGSALVIPAIVALLLGILFAVIIRRLALPREVPCATLDWLDNFSTDKYRPMERLLAEGDSAYLKTQPGFHPRMIHTLRAERRRIFRQYLRSITLDFERLHNTARLVLLHSPIDRPDLAKELIRQRTVFQIAILAIHAKLVLHWLGISGVSLDVRDLVGALESIRVQLFDLAVLNEPVID